MHLLVGSAFRGVVPAIPLHVRSIANMAAAMNSSVCDMSGATESRACIRRALIHAAITRLEYLLLLHMEKLLLMRMQLLLLLLLLQHPVEPIR